MRFLLISANRERQYPYPVPPIGAGMVISCLKMAGHNVDFCDVCFENNWREGIQHFQDENVFDMILISMRNIDNCLFPQTKEYISYYKELVSFCRLLFHVPILGGGIAMRMLGNLLLDEIDLDYGFIDKVSSDYVKGIEAIVNHKDPFEYYGFIGRNGKKSQKKSCEGYEALNTSLYENINIKKYLDKGGVIGFQTKYGCDLNCIYCSYPVIEGREIVCYNPVELVAVIEQVVIDNKLTFFEFADSTFNYPLNHAKDICRLLANKNLKVGWSAFISPRFVDEEFADLCKRSGCTGIDLGIDAASNTMLRNLGKGFTTDDIERACVLFKKYNIPICFNLLLGGPGENEKTLNETFDFLAKFDGCAVSAYSALRVYPHTPLEKLARKEGQVQGSLLYPQFYISKAIEKNLNEILEAHRKKHQEWMLRGITKPPSELVVERFQKGRTSPLWSEKINGLLTRIKPKK